MRVLRRLLRLTSEWLASSSPKSEMMMGGGGGGNSNSKQSSKMIDVKINPSREMRGPDLSGLWNAKKGRSAPESTAAASPGSSLPVPLQPSGGPPVQSCVNHSS